MFAIGVALPGAQRAATQRTLDQLEVVTNLFANQFEGQLTDTRYTAYLLATHTPVQERLQTYITTPSAQTKQDLIQLLERTVEAHFSVTSIAFLSPATGEVLLSSDSRRFIYQYDKSKNVALSQIQDFKKIPFSIVYTVDDSSPLLMATVPVYNKNGSIIVIEMVGVDFDTLMANLEESVTNLDTGRVFLVDGAGRWLSPAPKDPSAWRYSVLHTFAADQLRAGKSGVATYFDAQGNAVAGGYRWLPDLNVGIIVEMDRAIITDSLYRILLWSLLLVLAMMILTGFAARRLNVWLMSPLTQLIEAAQAFRQGDFSHRIPDPTDDEFGQVAVAFNQMAEKLESSYQTLAQQVQVRTAELQSANRQLQREIEDRIAVERQLRQSESRFRAAFLASPDAVTISTIDEGRYVEVNESFSNILGYSRDEVVGKTAAELRVWVNPAERKYMAKILLARGEIRSLASQFRAKDGTIIDGELSARVLPIQGTPHIIAIVRDLSYLRQTERALRESEKRYRNIFENSPVSLWEEDFSAVKAYLTSLEADGITDIPAYLRENVDAVKKCASLVKILDVNRATLSLFAVPKKEQIIGNLTQIFLPETYPVFAEQIIALWQQKRYFVVEQVEQTLTGQRIYARVSVSPAPGYEESLGRVFVSVQDMTVQVRAQQAIQKHNQELSLLNHIIAASALETDETPIFETACHELAQVFNASRAAVFIADEAMTSATLVAEYHDSGLSSIRGWHIPLQRNFIFRYLVAHQAPLLVGDIEKDARFAEYRSWLRKHHIGAFMLCPIIINGRIIGAMGVTTEIPRYFAAQDVNLLWSVADQISSVLTRIRLSAEHQRLVAAVEQIGESLIIADTDIRIVYVNPAFEKVTGYTRHEVVGESVNILYSADDTNWRERWHAVAAGQVWQGQVVTKTKDNARVIEDEMISPLRDRNQEIVGFVSVRRDITRELELENQYHQAQKMDAIGRLTSGVAHDFNNVLTAINGFAELMLRRLDPDDWEHSMVTGILKSGQRAAGLVRQLLLFSRKSTANPRVMDLNTTVTDMQKMLRRVIGENIEFNTNLAADLWHIKADPAQIEQVIVNLVVNARDALPNGGHLFVQTVNQTIEPGYIRHDLEMPAGKYVLLSVADDGVGMPPSVLEHIFEPFFTTKEKGKGTGLGLATVYGIIHQHGGFITVDSEVGQGTTFNIYLPAIPDATPDVPAPREKPPREITDVSGTETILVVEDEIAVREMAVRVLQQAGYTVYSAANGLEGVSVAEEYLDRLDAVLTDVVMPKLNGKAMAEEIIKKRASIKILFMSGYLSDVVFDDSAVFGKMKLLEKPFSPADLLQFVRRGLDSP